MIELGWVRERKFVCEKQCRMGRSSVKLGEVTIFG